MILCCHSELLMIILLLIMKQAAFGKYQMENAYPAFMQESSYRQQILLTKACSHITAFRHMLFPQLLYGKGLTQTGILSLHKMGMDMCRAMCISHHFMPS